MPPRKRKKRASRKPTPPPTGVLNWSDSRHWGGVDRTCRYCPLKTRLLDSKGKPAHKVCAERAIARQIAEYAAAYENERLPA